MDEDEQAAQVQERIRRRGPLIFLALQLFFVLFGIALFFGLKTLKETHRDAAVAAVRTTAD